MHSCPICYQRSKRQGARPFRQSLARVAAARLIEARDEIAVLLDCPFSGRLVRDFTVRAAHAANHLANSSPARFSVMLEDARFPIEEK
jgi:hypothetical protein